MAVLILMISILAFQMLIHMQFFEKRREFFTDEVKKVTLKFLKFSLLMAVFIIGAKYIFSRFEPIIIHLATDASELLTPERIDTLKNMVITYLSLTLDLSPTSVIFLSFMSFAYCAIFFLPGIAACYFFYQPKDDTGQPSCSTNGVHDPPDRGLARNKIFLELCQLRN